MTWRTNVRIQGQKSKASPALAEFGGRLHMVHLGDESNDIWHSQWNGSAWTANTAIFKQSSRFSPSLASFLNRLHIVHAGNSSNNIWYSQWDGSQWTVNVRIPGQASKATAPIAPFAGRLHLIHLGNTSNDLWHTSSDGTLSVIRIGMKFAVPPAFNVSAALAAAQTILGSVGFTIQEAAPPETLNVAVDLTDLDVGDCILGESTMEQNELFSFRNNLGQRDVAIYVVDAVVDPNSSLGGCASHPNTTPACVINDTASGALITHELCHVLGLRHVTDTNNIMWNKGSWTNQPPDVTLDQALTIQASNFSRE